MMSSARRTLGCWAAAVAAVAGGGPAAAQGQVSLTVYQQDLALVRHRHSYDLSAGENRIRLPGLSEQLLADTVSVRHGSNPAALTVSELSYRHLPLTPESLLRAYVGRNVGLIRTLPQSGQEIVQQARLISADAGLILEVDGRVETAHPGRVVLPGVPAELSTGPQLEVLLVSQDSGQQPVEISYLSTGLGWQADYVAQLAGDGETLSLDAWAAVANRTGASFVEAEVQLISGEPHRAPAEPGREAMLASRRLAAEAVAAVAREALGDYHLYRLPRRVSIAAGETRRVALLGARGVAVETRYRAAEPTPHFYQGRFGPAAQRIPVQRMLHLANRHEQGLGQPLPAGLVRVYQRDASGTQQFLGEDRIDPTAVAEPLSITLGQAFDIRGSKLQRSFETRPPGDGHSHAYASEVQITLRSAAHQTVEVEVVEQLPGDWSIENETHRHQRPSAAEAVWRLAVPAGGETRLVYRVLVRF